METISARPRFELSPFIRAFAQRRTFRRQQPIVEACPTYLEQLLEFEIAHPVDVSYPDGRHIVLSDVAIHGATTARVDVRIPAEHESFAVFFEPTGLSHLLGVPVSELTNQVHDATCVLGCWIRVLYEQIAGATSFQERVNIVERSFLPRLGPVARPETISLAAIYLQRRRGSADVSGVAQQFNLSVRQFERLFSRSIGISPKLWARIARFQSALDTKVAHPARTWLEIAHDVGYHDQMHLIHDFKELAGHTPSGLLTKLGDERPEAVATAATTPSSRSALRAA